MKLNIHDLATATSLAFIVATLAIITQPVNAQYMPNRVIQEQQSGPPPLRKYELIIKNRSGNDITQVYAKSLAMKNFSVDLIPNSVIRDGRQGLVNLIDGNGSCEWHIKTIHENSYKAEKVLNVCNTNTLTIN
jgi:hypothetical protein